ncbi:MAG: HAMP domain-containing sensor histidine kinase [Planctomycetota bacterium]
MTSPRATRRHALIAIVAVWALVLGGLGWATWSAVELDRHVAHDAWQRSCAELRALALSELDAVVAPVLYRESARPYNHFRRYYKPTEALNEENRSVIEEPIVLASPLSVGPPKPDWVLLHFQTRETDGEPVWSSPQLTEEGLFGIPVGEFPVEDRHRMASAENWLAAMRDRYTPTFLMNELETAVATRSENQEHLLGESAASLEAQSPTGRYTAQGALPTDVSRGATEFVRRGVRLLRMERESNVELCVPETVALENLDADVDPLLATDGQTAACVSVEHGPMTPLWLDLIEGGPKQPAFVRTVVVEGDVACNLQGVLLDWERLRSELLVAVKRAYPEAEIEPVGTAAPVAPSLRDYLMQTIPARLVPGTPAVALIAPLSSGLKVGLSVAWLATVLALLAIAYGVMKYVTLAERRMRFVAAVTHELRTPLTSFQLYTDLLADEPDSKSEHQSNYIETLRKESKRLGRLVENVLAYSRIGDSLPTLHPCAVRPRALLDAAEAATAGQCKAAGKELVVRSLCRDDLTIETDPEFVVQILTNLLENACKYSARAADPRIWLTVSEAAEGWLTFEVDDAGPGVPAHDRRNVFRPFRRSEPGDGGQSSGIGLGLGLALSRYWATCLGGRLALRRSTREAGGYSAFALSLPADALR